MEATTVDNQPKQLEIGDALFQTQRLAGIGTLTASVAHELTNPISVITATCNNLQALSSEGDLNSEELERYLEMINQSAWRCVRLIQMLQRYSHIDGPKAARSDLNEIIKDSLTLVSYQFEREYNISIVTKLASEMRPFYCDRNQITQVLINLLTNARDALPNEGGKIWIVSKYDEEDQRVGVSIRDNGGGISPIVIDRIFDPFFTTKEPGKGTGLGLAIASQIVEDHQGEISVDSGLNSGTTFVLDFPIRKQNREQLRLL